MIIEKINKLKEALKNGETIIGTWSSLSSSNVINALGSSNLDFVVIDMEHGSMTFETAENMVRTAEASKISPVIRVWDDQNQTILRALETGARSVMVPHISTKEDAARIVSCCKYFPEGNRGLSPYTRIHNFTHHEIAESLKSENDVTAVGILVEGETGLANLSEIVKVKGLDFIYLGLFDICQSVGLPGQISHPKVLEEISRCSKLIRSNGIAAGCMSTDISSIELLIKKDYQFIAYLNDAAALKIHYDELLLKVNNISKSN